MRVDERDTPPQEGEILHDVAAHLNYAITKAYGEIPHTLLGRTITDEAYEIEFEDGTKMRSSIYQMYSDEYVVERTTSDYQI